VTGKYLVFTHCSVSEFLDKEAVQREMAYQLIGFDVKNVAPYLLLAYLRSTMTATD
jgi:hypothetical protein